MCIRALPLLKPDHTVPVWGEKFFVLTKQPWLFGRFPWHSFGQILHWLQPSPNKAFFVDERWTNGIWYASLLGELVKIYIYIYIFRKCPYHPPNNPQFFPSLSIGWGRQCKLPVKWFQSILLLSCVWESKIFYLVRNTRKFLKIWKSTTSHGFT